MVSERSESNHPWHVYIALLADGRFYVGMTHVEPEERARRHQTLWGGAFTRQHRIVRILWQEKHSSSTSARRREQQLKRWSHAKKQALIEDDVDRLKCLARSQQDRYTGFIFVSYGPSIPSRPRLS